MSARMQPSSSRSSDWIICPSRTRRSDVMSPSSASYAALPRTHTQRTWSMRLSAAELRIAATSSDTPIGSLPGGEDDIDERVHRAHFGAPGGVVRELGVEIGSETHQQFDGVDRIKA